MNALLATDSVPSPWGRKDRQIMVGLVLALVIAHYAGTLSSGHLGSTLSGHDEQHYYAILRSAVFDGDFDFANEFNELTPHPNRLGKRIVPATGRLANKYGMGWAWVSAIPYLLVHGVLLLLGLFRGGFTYTGYEAPYQIAAATAQVVAGGVAFALIYRICRRYFSRLPSLAAVIFGLVGTASLYHTINNVHLAHATGVFAIALFCSLGFSIADGAEKPTRRWFAMWALFGFVASLMIVARYSSVLFLIFALHPILTTLRMQPRRDATRHLLIALSLATLAAIPLLAVQMGLWKVVHGSFLADSYNAKGAGFHWLNPALFGYFLSAKHGLFFWSPVLLGSFLGGIILLWRAPLSFSGERKIDRSTVVLFMLPALGLAYLNAAWSMWWFGHCFGTRAFVEASPMMCVGLAMLLSVPSKKVRLISYGLATLASCWTVLLWVMMAKRLIAPDGSTTGAVIIANLGKLFGA
jgi:hypothetical protein